jgi:plastocyanin
MTANVANLSAGSIRTDRVGGHTSATRAPGADRDLGYPGAHRLGGALAVCAALLAACGASDEGSMAKDGGAAKPVSQVLKLSVETAPGVVKFDKERLSAKAGLIAFELTNAKRKGHNIRIHTGDTCCFRPGSKDLGGTRTIGTGRTRVVLDLKPGTYTYLCSTGGYWRTQHGTLVVR